MHAQAWEDPIYQEAASQVEDREKTCDPCHAPEPILITGIGKMPKLRAGRSEVRRLLYRMPYRRTRRNARTS